MRGYAVAVELVRVIDGDTAVVRAVGRRGVVWAYRTTLFECPVGGSVALRLVQPGTEAKVRLAGFPEPEKRDPGGAEATVALARVLEKHRKRLWLFVEQPEDRNGNGETDVHEVVNQAFSFERVVGRLMVGDWDDGCVDVTSLLGA